MKRLVFLFLGFALTGCPGASMEDDIPTDAKTLLDGTVFLAAPLAEAHVEVFDFRQGRQGQRYAEAKTDASGRWSLDVGRNYGDYLVQASGAGLQSPLTAIVTGVKIQDHRDSVAITPITHLSAAYARFLLDGGMELTPAIAQARRYVHGHFGGLDHTNVRPWSSGGTDGASLTEGVKAHLLAASMQQLARRIALSNGLSEEGEVTMQTLLGALSEDVRADGVFDGIGAQGVRLLQAGTPLSGDTLRTDLAVSLIRFVETPFNNTRLGPKDVESLARQLADTQSPIFPTVATSLYLAPPTVTIQTPGNRSFINGTPEFLCLANSEVDLSQLTVRITRDGGALNEVLDGSDVVTHLDRGQGRLQGTLRTEQVSDGPVVLTCEAVDRNGTHAQSVVTATFNNRGPSVRVVGLPADHKVAGTLNLSCECSGDAELTRCALASPSAALGSAVREGLFAWDTTHEPEGPAVVSCEADSPGLPTTTASVPVFIDNRPDGRICGTVSLESPVQGADVRVYKFSNGRLGEELGYNASRSDATGAFCLAVRDVYRGPLMLVAGGPNAVYQSAIDAKSVGLGPTHLQLLVDDYEPNAFVSALSLNGLSTLAAALTAACVEPSGDGEVPACSAAAHGDLASLISRESFDVRSVPVADFVTDRGRAAEENSQATVMGLVHVGIARLGADLAVAHHRPIAQLSSATLWSRLMLDAVDRVFDGMDRDGKWIPLVDSATLTPETLRADLARAIARWLNNVRVSETLAGTNHTSLRSTNFAHDLLQHLASSTVRIFPPSTGVGQFDTEGPAISGLEARTFAGPTDLATPQRGELIIEANALDDSGVQEIYLELGGHRILNSESREAARAVFRVDTTQFKDDVYDGRICGVDGVGNVNCVNLAVRIDNTAPELSVRRESKWLKEGQAARLELSSSKNITRLEASSRDAETRKIALPPNTKAYAFDYPTACDAVVEIQIRAWDSAGNEASSSTTVVCDSHSPSLELVEHGFRQERLLNASYREDGGDLLYTEQNRSAYFAVDSQTEWPVTFQKYFNRLDHLPEQGRDVVTNNLPAIRFSVDDSSASGAGTTASDLVVEYQFLIRDELKRSWTRLASADSASVYIIPFSYQSLHPDIAQSKLADLHRIDIRVIDMAGNVTQRSFPFFLDIVAPPAWLGDCRMDAAVTRHRLAAGNMHEFFTPGAKRVFSATLHQKLDLPAGSLAPRGGIEAEVTPAPVTVKITEVRSEKYEAPLYSISGPNGWCPIGEYHTFPSPGARAGAWDPSPCNPGYQQDGALVWHESQGGNIDDLTSSPTVAEVSQGARVISPSASNQFLISEGQAAQLISVAHQPRITLGGQPYDWSTAVAATPGMTGPQAQSRYRLHHLDRSGTDHLTRHNPRFQSPDRFQRRFQTQAYISGFRILTSTPAVGARQVILDLPLQVQTAPSCTAQLFHEG